MHLRYLLDTNICIYIMKQSPDAVFNTFQEKKVGSVGMSIITHGELYYGCQKSQSSEKAKQLLNELSRYIMPLPLPKETSMYYGEIRRSFEKEGTPIDNNDLWIAAHAVAANLILVSNNTKEFSRIKTLPLENWTKTLN